LHKHIFVSVRTDEEQLLHEMDWLILEASNCALLSLEAIEKKRS